MKIWVLFLPPGVKKTRIFSAWKAEPAAAGYASSTNILVVATYDSEGYINMACGNWGKQDTATDEDGNESYTGKAPCCLVDQKNAARFIRYNILLGNLPGSKVYFVSTGGSGSGVHAIIFAATSDNSNYYDYERDAGASACICWKTVHDPPQWP